MRRVLLALLLLTAPVPAWAQAWQCRVPPRVSVPPMERPDGPVRIVRTEGYTLALSWSPEFCRDRGSDPRHALQCSGTMGRFGFVLHGLWPEGASEPPQWCPASRAPSAETVRRNLCRTPSPDLIVHEWAKHGSCMTRDPDAYFTAGSALYGSIGFPDMARLSRRPGLTAGAVRDALIAENPSLKRRIIRLKLSRTGWLQEVQLCYDRRFMPTLCHRTGAPDHAPVKIWRSF